MHTQLTAVLILAMTAGCQTASAPSQSDVIGQKRWFRPTGSATVCASPGLDRDCKAIRTGSATVEAFERSTRSEVYKVRLDDGSTGYLSVLDFLLMHSEAAHKQEIAANKDCERRGGVAVGMTAKQVEATCWGKPTSVNRTVTGAGAREQWVYPGYNYVYLVNGVVTSIQTSSR